MTFFFYVWTIKIDFFQLCPFKKEYKLQKEEARWHHCGKSERCVSGVLVVVIVDICPVPVWAGAARSQGSVFIVVMLATLVTGLEVVHPVGQIRFKSLKEMRGKGFKYKSQKSESQMSHA